MRELLFICSDLNVGGTERQLVAIATALTRSDWRVTIYSLAGRGPLQSEAELGNVTVIVPPIDRPSRGAFGIGRILVLALTAIHLSFVMLKRRPAIVHFMLPEAYLVGGPLSKVFGIPVRVMSRRSLNLYQGRGPVRTIERYLHRAMHAILGNSLSIIGQLKGEGVPIDRLGLIYNGIDVSAFANRDAGAACRNSLGIAPDVLVMSLVANLIRYKGHRDLLDALGKAAKTLPANWRMLLAGRDDGIGAQLQQQAQRLGIAENVVFLGARNDVAALLAASDIGILCSHEEGFANAILEGMAARLPMIVTNVGGNAEAVIDGVTGLVVPAHEPDRLAAAIVQLANNADMRNAFGAAGYKRVSERFAMDRCLAAHDQLYRKLLAGGVPADLPQISVS